MLDFIQLKELRITSQQSRVLKLIKAAKLNYYTIMLLHKSIVLITIIYITTSLSLPLAERNSTAMGKRNRLRKRSKDVKPKMLKGKRKKSTPEEDCDWVEGFCEKCTGYPRTEINKLLKEQNFPTYDFYVKPYEEVKTRSNVYEENVCEILSRTLVPRVAKTSSRNKKEYIVQGDHNKQSIYMEVCMSEKTKLNFDCLPDGYREVKCVQQYRLIPLLVFDEKSKQIRSDQFKVPSGCSVEYQRVKTIPVLL